MTVTVDKFSGTTQAAYGVELLSVEGLDETTPDENVASGSSGNDTASVSRTAPGSGDHTVVWWFGGTDNVAVTWATPDTGYTRLGQSGTQDMASQVWQSGSSTATSVNETWSSSGTEYYTFGISIQLIEGATGTVEIGLTTETDSSLGMTAVAGAVTGQLGLTTETDTSLAMTAVAGALTGAVGLTTETDTALGMTAVAGAVSVAVGLTTETDTALSVTPVAGAQTVAIGLATETDTSLSMTPVAGGITGALGLVTETDTSLDITAVAGAITGAIGISSETDTALDIEPITPGSVVLGISSETDTALDTTAVAGGLTGAIGISSETDTAPAVTTLGVADVELASETETALSITPVAGAITGAIGLVTETDTALSVSPQSSGNVIMGLTTETDSALVITPREVSFVPIGDNLVFDSWGPTFFDDFGTLGTYDSGALGANWTAFNSAGNAGNGLRRTSAVEVVTDASDVSNGQSLRIRASWDGTDITSGIVQLTGEAMLYGKWRFRCRGTGDASNQMSPVILLWPEDDDWPAKGEINIWEGIDARDDLNPMKSFLHSPHPQSGLDRNISVITWETPTFAYTPLGTDWHTWEVRWLPNLIEIEVDDTLVATLSSNYYDIPDWPMKLAIQLDAWSNNSLPADVDMFVAWVLSEPAVFQKTDIAQPITVAQAAVPLGFAFEADTALSFQPASIGLGVATEYSSARPIEVNPEVLPEPILEMDDWVNSPPEWGQYGAKVNDWMHDLAAVVRQSKTFIENDGTLLWSRTYQVDLDGITNQTLDPLPMVLGNGDHMPRFGFPTTMIIEAMGIHGVNSDPNADALWSIRDQYDTTAGTVKGNNLSIWTGEYQSLGSVNEWTPFQLVGGKELATGARGAWSAGVAVTAGLYSNKSLWKVSLFRGHILPGNTTYQQPPITSHQVNFRTGWDPASKSPVATLAALGASVTNIARSALDGILNTWVSGTGGTTHNCTTLTEWNTATAAAVPGDLIRVTSEINANLNARGSKYGITGGTMVDGSAGLPIILTCADGVYVDVNNTSDNESALDIQNVSHVWAVGMNVRDSQFGMRLQNVDGTAANPVRVAYCNIENTGHANFSIAGWFQAITSSGGTPPSGAGNEWGFSSNVVVENNTISDPGRISDQFGECVYLGHGGSPGWISYAKDIWVRHNTLSGCTADFFDIKPGCSNIYIYDNVASNGYFVFGGAVQCLYVAAGIDNRPSWYNYDPNVVVEGNRLYDGNVTTTNGSSSNYCCQTSLCGVLFANNLCWGFANGGVGFRLRSEKAASQSQVGSEIWTVVNNLFWMDNGVSNVGAPSASPAPFSSALIDARNNIGPSGASGVTHTASSSDFIDSAAIPAVDTVNADAEWETYGTGSAFDLALASSLVGAGTSISDIALGINQDISQRAIPSSSPNPGPFQQHPANL